MKENEKCTPVTGDEVIDEASLPEQESKENTISDTNEKIYNALEIAEKIAVKLAQINQILKKAKKKRKKKNKKLGKVDKKTGTLILKPEKKEKIAKPLKKYSPPKKK